MTLKEAIDIANQFNDTIFTNTQEMVDAVTVLIDYAESNKPEPTDTERLDWLEKQNEEIVDGYQIWLSSPETKTIREAIDRAMEEDKRTEEEKR
ncbi:MAG: hypothetical protein KKB31_05935 [Nanoarchaeota archaeon]|nr:hypothetical protein [Nanoarchaeota archaeon]